MKYEIKMNNKINSNELRSINSETAQRTVESSSSASKEGGKGAPGDEATIEGERGSPSKGSRTNRGGRVADKKKYG